MWVRPNFHQTMQGCEHLTSGAMQWRPWRVLLSRSQSSQKASGQPALHAAPCLYRALRTCSQISCLSSSQAIIASCTAF